MGVNAAASLENSLQHPVEDFGTPCCKFQFLGGTLIRDPRDGSLNFELNSA